MWLYENLFLFLKYKDESSDLEVKNDHEKDNPEDLNFKRNQY